jgi:hypothetical protein
MIGSWRLRYPVFVRFPFPNAQRWFLSCPLFVHCPWIFLGFKLWSLALRPVLLYYGLCTCNDEQNSRGEDGVAKGVGSSLGLEPLRQLESH